MPSNNDDFQAHNFDTATALRYQQERITAQLSFARSLAEMHSEKKERWQQPLKEAQRLGQLAIDQGDIQHLVRSVRQAEAVLRPFAATAKQYTIYCVGHAHIDMNWQWSWPETVSVTIDSLTTVLRLMREFPGFKFSQSQASIYEILERYRADLLEEVRNRVQEGRWEVTASHWVESDKNLVNGESLCRHLLYTRAYMHALFGLEPEDVPIDWAPDTFGHAHSVPAYLVRGAVKYVYLHRPGAHGGQERPEAFWWAAADGSRVLVRNDMHNGYNGQIGPEIVPSCLLPFYHETGLPFAMFVYGVGDHGGGPTRRDLARLVDMDAWPVFPRVEFATARAFFERLESEGSRLSTLQEELNFEFTGCYTSQTLIKRANRLSENSLRDAETASLVALNLADVPYPAGQLVDRWRDHLFSHFHDILPGSGVHDTRTYAHGSFQAVTAFTGSAQTRALRAIAARICTDSLQGESQSVLGYNAARSMGAGAGKQAAEGGMSLFGMDSGGAEHPLVLFNTTDSERTEVVEAEIWDSGFGWEQSESPVVFSVRDAVGSEYPAQILEHGEYWGHRFQRIAFPVQVAGFGYATYVVTEHAREIDQSHADQACESETARQTGRVHVCRYAVFERGPEGLENEFLKLEVDPHSGGIAKLTDLVSGKNLAGNSTGESLLQFAVERARPMSAWQIEHTGPVTQPRVRQIKRVHNGPYKASLLVSMRVGQSDLNLTYELRAGDPKLYLHIQGLWLERGGEEIGTPLLRFCLPLRLRNARTIYETPFGALERCMPGGDEVPALRWAQVSGELDGQSASCVLYNDSKHGHSFCDDRLYLTLIRSSFAPDPLPEIGEHEIQLAVECFAGCPDPGSVAREAAAFTRSLKVISTDVHEGELPPRDQFLELDAGRAVLSCLKREENGDGVIARFYNPTAQGTDVELALHQSFGEVAEAREVDLLERELAAAPLRIRQNRVVLHVAAFAISTLRIRTKPEATNREASFGPAGLECR